MKFCIWRDVFWGIKDLFYNSKKTLTKYNIRSVSSLNRKLNNIIRLGKDKTDKWDTPGAAYKFDCQKCDACYIGESKRPVFARISTLHYSL